MKLCSLHKAYDWCCLFVFVFLLHYFNMTNYKIEVGIN